MQTRQVTRGDIDAVFDLLSRRPAENLFLAARLLDSDLDPARLGHDLWGCWRDGALAGVCHAGGNIVPVADDAEVCVALADTLGRRRWAGSIMGASDAVLGLYAELVRRSASSWGHPRNIRRTQPLMELTHAPRGPVDPRVRRVTLDDFDAYFDASVKMYTEEIGTSPLGPGSGYASFVRRRISSGYAFGWIEDGRVLFKTDIGPAAGVLCQIQGVWLDPSLRGQGLAGSAVAQAVEFCQQMFPVVTLYVNGFNTPAIRTYERLGFRTIGTMSTVHY